MTVHERITALHEALDHVESAHKLVESIDGAASTELHGVKCQLERTLTGLLLTRERKAWRERPLQGP